ncbi:PF20097 family protein [Sporosarcina sp. Marseille-Q4063]|uniref:PF20097 family protein n=1 Tax=Sporosarcina sp. Marseille-Q4063 TaxID=2810514 RepID=UPI00201630DC|nr:PF20097 family protein [Sporosarcina sp. Marseille-Q4063]
MNDTIRCLGCSNELSEGYIFSPRRICWSESADSIFADFGSSEVLISDPIFKIRKTPAFRCEKCNLVTFKYK